MGLGSFLEKTLETAKKKLLGKKLEKVDREQERVRQTILHEAQHVRTQVDEDLTHPEKRLAEQVCSKLDAKTKIKTLKVLHSLYRAENTLRIKDDTSEKTKQQVRAQIQQMAQKRGMAASELEKAIHEQLWNEFQQEKTAMKYNAAEIEPKKLEQAKQQLQKNAELIVDQVRSGKDAELIEQELMHQLQREFDENYTGENNASKAVSEKVQRILYRLSQRTGLKKAVYEQLGGVAGMLGPQVEGYLGPQEQTTSPKNVQEMEGYLPGAEPVGMLEGKVGNVDNGQTKNVRLEDLNSEQKAELRKQAEAMISQLEQADSDQRAEKKLEESTSAPDQMVGYLPEAEKKSQKEKNNMVKPRANPDEIFKKWKTKNKTDASKKTMETTGNSRLDFILRSLDQKTGGYYRNLDEMEKKIQESPNTASPYHVRQNLTKLLNMLHDSNENGFAYEKTEKALLNALITTESILGPVKNKRQFSDFYDYLGRKIEDLRGNKSLSVRKVA
ncbi:MAG: hypothetical protein AB7J40_02935 [Candidatus Altimarinota bacterium]